MIDDRMPKLLELGRPPAHWVAVLRERGIAISERTLREKANRLNACHKVGRAMIITPDQLDTILTHGDTCRLNHISGAAHGGRKGASNTSTYPLPITTVAALEHLQKKPRGNGAGLKKNASGVVTSLAQKRKKPR